MARKRRKSEESSSSMPPAAAGDTGPHLQDDQGLFASSSAYLVGVPTYPNCIKWSDDNFIAVATSQLVTILNPAFIEGPRGLVTASSEQPYHVGRIYPEDLQAPCLLPICLAKETKPLVRCVDWSPQGFSPTGGCLLAVCTNDYRVKVYRYPNNEYRCEWVEVMDLSEIMYNHYFKDEMPPGYLWTRIPTVNTKQDYDGNNKQSEWESNTEVGNPNATAVVPLYKNLLGSMQKCFTDPVKRKHQSYNQNPQDYQIVTYPAPPVKQKYSDEFTLIPREWVAPLIDGSKISASLYRQYRDMLAFLVVSWSPILSIRSDKYKEDMVLIALGAKTGEVTVMRVMRPREYALQKMDCGPDVCLVGVFQAHESWVLALSWTKGHKSIEFESETLQEYQEEVFLATGSSDGSVSIWFGDVHKLIDVSRDTSPFTLMKRVISSDAVPVTSLALSMPVKCSNVLRVAVGKTSGGVFTAEINRKEGHFYEDSQHGKHSQTVTGVIWAAGGHCLYSCSQDKVLQAWKFTGKELIALTFPQDPIAANKELEESSALPNSILDGYFGLTLSKGSLSLATVSRLSSEVLDPMYQSRAMKGVVEIYFIGGQLLNEMPMYDSPIQAKCDVNISDSVLKAWEMHMLEALDYLKDVSNTPVLWDINTSFDCLSSIVGNEFVNRVVSDLLVSMGFTKGHNSVLPPPEDYKKRLSYTTCRCLQILYVIFKHLHANGESHSEKSCSGFLLDVEQEIQERLVDFMLTIELIRIRRSRSAEVVYSNDDSSASCMVLWVQANSARVSHHVVKKAERVCAKLKGKLEDEHCSMCGSKVPFISHEFGECQGTQKHKFPRCSVTFRLCSPGFNWYCNGCERRVSKQISRTFLKLDNKHVIDQLQDTNGLHEDDVEPRCPYCGILMQRLLPDCLLRMCLT